MLYIGRNSYYGSISPLQTFNYDAAVVVGALLVMGMSESLLMNNAESTLQRKVPTVPQL